MMAARAVTAAQVTGETPRDSPSRGARPVGR